MLIALLFTEDVGNSGNNGWGKLNLLFMAVKKNAKTYTIWLGRISKKLKKGY